MLHDGGDTADADEVGSGSFDALDEEFSFRGSKSPDADESSSRLDGGEEVEEEVMDRGSHDRARVDGGATFPPRIGDD